MKRRQRGFCASQEGIHKIRMRMSELGWSVDDLAEEVDVSIDTLKRLINPHWKNNKVGWQYVCRIAKALDLNPIDIVAPRECDLSANHKEGNLLSMSTTLPDYYNQISAFALSRPLEEAQCLKTLQEPSSLVRIKGPKKMGKTTFLDNILHQLKQEEYQIVTFNFQTLGSDVLDNLEDFLKAFCSGISDRLNIPEKLNSYWNNSLSNNYRATKYFQEYILSKVSDRFILVLEQVDLVFEHPKIAKDFCNLLASWYREAQSGNETSQIWQRLRLVIVHNTDIYSFLDINHSPLAGLGTVIELEEFTLSQIQALVEKYNLNTETGHYESLIELVGGHPYLIDRALKNLANSQVTFEELLNKAATEEGIYQEHLRELWGTIKNQNELKAAFKKVVTSSASVSIDRILAFKLGGLGLIKREGNNVTCRCRLYYQYFQTLFNETSL